MRTLALLVLLCATAAGAPPLDYLLLPDCRNFAGTEGALGLRLRELATLNACVENPAPNACPVDNPAFAAQLDGAGRLPDGTMCIGGKDCRFERADYLPMLECFDPGCGNERDAYLWNHRTPRCTGRPELCDVQGWFLDERTPYVTPDGVWHVADRDVR